MNFQSEKFPVNTSFNSKRPLPDRWNEVELRGTGLAVTRWLPPKTHIPCPVPPLIDHPQRFLGHDCWQRDGIPFLPNVEEFSKFQNRGESG